MSQRRWVSTGIGLLASAALALGCDPSEDPPVWRDGPPFLIVAPAGQSVDSGIALYAQARGGNWLALSTEGCTHALGEFSGVTRSCGQVPYSSTAPLIITVDPEDTSCTVHASLYSVCDCDAGFPGDFSSGAYYTWCDTVGTLVASQILAVGPANARPNVDAGVDDAPDGGGA